jgi:uncharacterized protein (DUF1330 family)
MKGETRMSNPVYMVGIIDVKDFQTYAEQYGMPVGEMFAEVGAEIVAASTEAEVLEGNWDGNWSVIVKVPSAEIARDLYNSEKYAPFKRARQDTLANQTTLAIVPALG